MAVWYISCSFGTFFPVLVSCTKKNLATLAKSASDVQQKSFFLKTLNAAAAGVSESKKNFAGQTSDFDS
jgi:hypothetical protein